MTSFNVTSFNYDGKMVRDVGLSFLLFCYVFAFFFFFFCGVILVFSRDERDGISFITITSVGMGKS